MTIAAIVENVSKLKKTIKETTMLIRNTTNLAAAILFIRPSMAFTLPSNLKIIFSSSVSLFVSIVK
jgi:hypothetical protein